MRRLLAAALALAACSDPQAADVAASRGLELARAGDLDAARVAFDEALDLDGDNKKALFNLGVLHLRRGEGAPAAKVLRRFLAEAPGDAVGQLQLARALMLEGRPDDALDALRLSVEAGLADHGVLREARELRPVWNDERFLALERLVAERAGVPAGQSLDTSAGAPYGGKPAAERTPGIRGPGECAGKARNEAGECG